jgi:hypothetical protein
VICVLVAGSECCSARVHVHASMHGKTRRNLRGRSAG